MFKAISELGKKFLLQLDEEAKSYIEEEQEDVSALLAKLKNVPSEEQGKSPDQKNDDSK